MQEELTIIDEPAIVPGTASHAEDDFVVAAAASAGTDVLVTGDRELLDLHQYEAVLIYSPSHFVHVMKITEWPPRGRLGAPSPVSGWSTEGNVVETQISGYGLYWKRIARHLSLSQVAKQLGLKASDLSALEQGKEHPLSQEQVGAYAELLESIPVEEAPEPSAEA